tara:strand:- start:118 stop:1005 length:888 start_codon:yes stop_codon:yes gene_type:complete
LGKNLLNNLKLSEEVDLEEFKQNIVNARKNKNLSVKDASQILNISEDIINNLEKGYFNELNKNVFIVGHIRTYLNLIEIDPKLLINNYKAKEILLKTKSQNIIIPYNFKLSRKNILLLSIFLFILVLLIYREINKLNEKYIIEDNKELIFEEKNENKEEEKNLQNKEEAKTIINENKEEETIQNKEEAKPITDKNKSNEKISSEVKNIDFIYIEAIEDAWIEIQDKNTKVIVSKIIKKEEKIKLPYQKDLILVTGNAGGIIIKIDNNIINKIGESKEVKRNISLNLEDLIKYIEE